MGYALFANSTLSSAALQAELERRRQLLEALQTQSGGLNFVSSSAVSLNNETISNDELLCSNYDDTIKNFGSYITVRAHAGNDYIEHNYYYNTSTYAITSAASYAYTDAGDGNDTVYNFGGTDPTMLGGAGVNHIYNGGGANAIIYGGDDNDSIVNDGQFDGNNVPFLSPDYSFIDGGAGSDTVINWIGKYSMLYGGEGDDELGNTAEHASLYGGDGNDWIWNTWCYHSGEEVSRGHYSYLDGGDGDDDIASRNIGVTINGGTGNDSLQLDHGATDGSINGGAGNDLISLTSDVSNNVIAYAAGDGFDTVYGFKSDDTVHIIDDSKYLVTISGSDMIVSLDGGSILLKDARSNLVKVVGGSQRGAMSFTNSTGNTVITGTNNADFIRNWSGENVTINVGDGNDSITNLGENVSINAGAGYDSINIWAPYSTINGGTGNDIINFSAGYQNVIEYANGDGFDTVYGYTSNATLSITDRASYSTMQSGSDVIVSIGTGAITLKDAADKTLNIAGGTPSTVEPEPETVEPATPDTLISNVDANANIVGTDNADSITNNGSYSIINAGAGNDTVRNNVYANNSTLNGGAGNDYINNWASNVIVNGGNNNDTLINNASNALISGGDGNDFLFNSTENGNANNTLDGGAGNDIISLSGGANFIRYSSGNGNDTVYGYTSTETIAIEGGTYTTQRSGADTIIKVGNNQILVKNYNGALSILGESDTVGLNVNNTVSGITLNGTDYNDTITNNYAEYVSINAGAGNDSIVGTNNYTTTDGGAGNDTIVGNHWRSIVKGGAGNDFISLSAYWYDTIDGGTNDDTILTGGFDSSVNGGDGNDLISLSGGNVTVRGGAGNDTIRSTGSGGNLYQYTVGDGNDTVFGFGDNDTLTITGGDFTTLTVGNNVVVYMEDGGNILLNDAKGKTININNANNSVDTVDAVDTNSPQDVIKRFMKSLDDSTEPVMIDMLNNAIKDAAGGKYSNIQDVIDQMIADCQKYNAADDKNGWKRFLLEKCDIDLDNDDTGAISGYDAGGSDEMKTNENIVSENIELDSSFEDSFFEFVNLNVSLGKKTASNTVEKTDYNSLSTEEKKTWQGLQSDWLQNSLSLNEESYGNNFSFGNKSTSTLQENTLYVMFKNEKSSEFASVSPGTINNKGETKGPLTLTINTYKFPAFKNGKVDDAYVSADDNYIGNSYYFERILAHELTHAVMDANILNATGPNGLPQFIKEGMAELTHGCDDKRQDELYIYAKNPESLKEALDLKPYGNNGAYAGGYMFLRYIAKQFSSKGEADSYDVAIQSPSDSYIEPPEGMMIVGSSLLSVSSAFAGDRIIFSDYGADINKANATALTKDVAILGGTLNDSLNGGSGNDKLYGGDGNDTLIGNAGDDTLTGGSGSDLFVYASGDDVIADYAAGVDKIQLRNCSIANSTLDGDDVIINTEGGALIVKDGRDQLITVIDRNGAESTKIYGKNVLTADNVGEFEGVTLKSSKLTLGTPFTGSVDLADFSSKVKTVDATKTTGAVEIIGNDKANTFKAGSGGSTLDGAGGNDKLYGGDGVDVFIFDGQGKDKIYNYEAGDRIVLTEAVTKSKLSGKNLKITVEGGGVLTVNKIFETPMTITTADGQTNNYVFDKKHKTLEDALNNTAAQLPSDYWFLDDPIEESPLKEIISTDNAVALDYDQTVEALKPSDMNLEKIFFVPPTRPRKIFFQKNG